MSVNVPLHKWLSADPVILIGRRCIAQTDQDVIIDGRLELIRHPDGTASLRFQGIGNDIIAHDPNTCSNNMSAITEASPSTERNEMHHTDTVRIATNPRKWRRPAPCPACRKSRPLILTLGTIYNLRTRKPVNTIYGCICPNCRHKCILHVDGKNLKKAIRLWNHHASHHQRNEQ